MAGSMERLTRELLLYLFDFAAADLVDVLALEMALPPTLCPDRLMLWLRLLDARGLRCALCSDAPIRYAPQSGPGDLARLKMSFQHMSRASTVVAGGWKCSDSTEALRCAVFARRTCTLAATPSDARCFHFDLTFCAPALRAFVHNLEVSYEDRHRWRSKSVRSRELHIPFGGERSLIVALHLYSFGTHLLPDSALPESALEDIYRRRRWPQPAGLSLELEVKMRPPVEEGSWALSLLCQSRVVLAQKEFVCQVDTGRNGLCHTLALDFMHPICEDVLQTQQSCVQTWSRTCRNPAVATATWNESLADTIVLPLHKPSDNEMATSDFESEIFRGTCAVLRRGGGVGFAMKTRRAWRAGARACLILDTDNMDTATCMTCYWQGQLCEDPCIPAALISSTMVEHLHKHMALGGRIRLRIDARPIPRPPVLRSALQRGLQGLPLHAMLNWSH